MMNIDESSSGQAELQFPLPVPSKSSTPVEFDVRLENVGQLLPVELTNAQGEQEPEEILLNKLLMNDDLTPQSLRHLIQRLPPDPSKTRTRFQMRPIEDPIDQQRRNPKQVALEQRLANSAVISLGLLDIESYRQRIEMFIGYCRYCNYTYNTAINYYRAVGNLGIFGPRDGVYATLRPDKRAFAANGRSHERVVSVEDFKTFFQYLSAHPTHANAPLLIASYTGLRSSEVLMFSLATLEQLSEQRPLINIARKNTVKRTSFNEENIQNRWKPVYTSYLVRLIRWLCQDLFAEQYNEFLRTRVNDLLFKVSVQTLSNRMHALFLQAVKRRAPLGFGIHSFRYMLAIMMAKNANGNMRPIQLFLQHRKSATTRRYLTADFSETAVEFNRLTRTPFATIREALQRTNTAAQHRLNDAAERTTNHQTYSESHKQTYHASEHQHVYNGTEQQQRHVDNGTELQPSLEKPSDTKFDRHQVAYVDTPWVQTKVLPVFVVDSPTTTTTDESMKPE